MRLRGVCALVLPFPLPSRNNTSPALLVYNTPNLKITNTNFLNNTPETLPLEIAQSECYFTRGENSTFFLDNRTTSGGISLYMDGATTKVSIDNCTFVDNTARNDSDVLLVRRSRRNGHGGAMNIRILGSTNSTVCLRRSLFRRNSAQAHAGALAISVGYLTTLTRFVISDTSFEDNWCFIEKCTGGAVGANYLPGSSFITLSFLDSNFTGNEARSSGAIVLSTSVSADNLSDTLRLRNCWFVGNRAFFEGTALGVFSITQTNQIGIPVDIIDW